MRETVDSRGRMPYRLWYEEDEIEAIMDDELRAAGRPRLGNGLAVDIDAFIERRLGVVPEYVPLPAGVHGSAGFAADGTARIQISAALSVKAQRRRSAERRLRSTLAHEAAHVILHRSLFLKESGALFGRRGAARLCGDIRFSGRAYGGEWWEWQANRGMAALLLPRRDVLSQVDAGGWASVGRLSEDFEVSPTAVRYRLQQLGKRTASARLITGS